MNNYSHLPIIVALSGASGTIYGMRTLQFLLTNNYKVELVISESASKVAKEEINLDLSLNPEILKEQVLAHVSGQKSDIRSQKSEVRDELLNVWGHDDISAAI